MFINSKSILIRDLLELKALAPCAIRVNQDLSVTIQVRPADLYLYEAMPKSTLRELIMICLDSRDSCIHCASNIPV